MKKHIILLLLAFASTTAKAQQADSASRARLDSLYARARQLVLEGNGTVGRALIDSLVNTSAAGTPAHVDALFWRASLAGTASDAERDYRRIIVEYPLSVRSADALLSLAQLEIARGDRENAALHLQRFLLDHPESPERARASLSLGRMLIEQGRVARGCAVIGRGRGALSSDAVELRNQMDYYAQRCEGVDTVEVVAAQPLRTDTGTPPRGAPPRGAPPGTDTIRKIAAPPVRQAVVPSSSAPAPVAPRRDTAAPGTTATRPAPARDTTTKRADTAAKKPVTAPAPAPAAASRFTVQVAAFETKAEADQLVDRLKKRGLAARVFGTARPFRVRIGRFTSESVASDLLKSLRAQGMNGFVTPAEPEAR
jgi:cell division septation protein DedD